MFEYSVSSFLVLGNTHLGLLIAIIGSIIYSFIFPNFVYDIVHKHVENDSLCIFISLLPPVLVVVWVAIVSYINDDSFDCTAVQEVVTAEFVNFLPEVYKERKGKHDVTSHKMYVLYRYKDDSFTFETHNASAMPKYARFYRIDVQKYPRCSKSH